MVDVFEEFLMGTDVSERTLAIVGGNHPKPIRDLFEKTFGSLQLDTDSLQPGSEPEGVPDDSVVLLEDGSVVATSPMSRLRNAVLLVNSDLYTTGLSGIDTHEPPEVIAALDEAVYTLRGFPDSTKEKLLLTVMSRYIERRALEVGDGRLDVAFQQISRLNDEYGTKTVYDRLARTDVDVHVYGVPDDPPSDIDGLTVHSGRTPRYQRSWFVVFTPDGDDAEPAALVAVEMGDNIWRSRWTYDPERVETIQREIVTRF